jgi:hypothetical protein
MISRGVIIAFFECFV